MRPAGEVRKVLMDAVRIKPGSTLQELAMHAQVGIEAARRTVDNLRRSGAIVRGPARVVTYRNRPVATWLPAANDDSLRDIAAVMRAWG